jgi:hypothetical protein
MLRGIGRLRARQGSFSPASIFAGGAKGAWYDPSDITSLFQDGAGTTPVAASGDPLGRMLDKSGRSNRVSQATAAARPTYTVGGGFSYFASDGVDDGLTSAAFAAGTFTADMDMFRGQRPGQLLVTPSQWMERQSQTRGMRFSTCLERGQLWRCAM